MTFLRFPLDRGKAFIRHYASSSEKSHVCLRCSVVNALATLRLHYQLFSAKRSSLRSERCRSELLFAGSGNFELLFYVLHFICAYGAFFVSAALPTFFGNAFLYSFKNLVCGCGEDGFCRKRGIIPAKNALKIIKQASNVLTNASLGNIIFIPRDKDVP